MAKRERINQLAYQLKSNLTAQESYGQSKYLCKQETKRLRSLKTQELKKLGYNIKDIQKSVSKINTYKDRIFSYCTMKTYLRVSEKFADYVCKMESKQRVSVNTARTYIQQYINSLVAYGYSPSTINTHLAGVCKATGTYISDYTHPLRHYAEVTRGVRPAKRDKFNSHRAGNAIELERAVGLRRSELARLSVKDVSFS